MPLSKRMKYLREQTKTYTPMPVEAAVKRLKGLEGGMPANIPPVKFDQTVEMAFRLGIDPKQADQMVRGSIVLPNGIGKEQRVIVFAKGDASSPPRRPAPTRRAAKSWPTASKRAGPTSMSRSPRRT